MSEAQKMSVPEMVRFSEDRQKDYAKKRAAAALRTALIEAARLRREKAAAEAEKEGGQ